jgi:ATP-dependent helicase HepA
VAEGRRAQHEGYDPLLDLRSAALPELARLVSSAFRRLGEEPPEDLGRTGEGTQEALLALSRTLEEQLEEVCADVGRRVGVDVDTDQNVHPFEVSFTLGAHMRIEALPGMEMPEEPVTYLGSFWRETAVARDELHWFATGHKLVEALVGLVRDGDAGRAAALAEAIVRRGVYVVGFSYPVVPMGKARIRTQMSAAHTIEDLDFAAEQFAAARDELRARGLSKSGSFVPGE